MEMFDFVELSLNGMGECYHFFLVFEFILIALK